MRHRRRASATAQVQRKLSFKKSTDRMYSTLLRRIIPLFALTTPPPSPAPSFSSGSALPSFFSPLAGGVPPAPFVPFVATPKRRSSPDADSEAGIDSVAESIWGTPKASVSTTAKEGGRKA